MENRNQYYDNSNIIDVTHSASKTFIANVFAYMSFALAITGFVAYFLGSSPAAMQYIFGDSALRLAAMFAPFIFVLVMSLALNKLSFQALFALFFIYASLMGVSLSVIFLIYTGQSIFSTFLITAGTFGIMAFVGYTTQTDLTKFGSILMMALIGIIIAGIVNIFLKSSMMEMAISALGVLIFTGLTAYDMQKIKTISQTAGEQTGGNKLAIMGALTLYLDFINLFIMLLRFMGDKRRD